VHAYRLAACSLLVVSCSCAGGTSAQRAVLAPTVVSNAELAPAATADRYRIDAATSVVDVVGSDSVTGEHPVHLPAMQGTITREGDALRVQFVLDMRELRADPDVQDVMRNELLEVKRFPDCTFASKAVVPAGEHASVTGNLTLHGVTRAITFDAEIKSAAGTVDVRADFTLPRNEFDIHRHDSFDSLIHDEVRVHVALHAVADLTAPASTPSASASASPAAASPPPQPAPPPAASASPP
jgi:polyisoprenoid-binding protein YceI